MGAALSKLLILQQFKSSTSLLELAFSWNYCSGLNNRNGKSCNDNNTIRSATTVSLLYKNGSNPNFSHAI